MERAWLAVPYLGTKFLKYLVLGVYLQVLILLLPISVADFLLSPSNPLFLYAGLDAALNVPLESALLTYVFAATVPMQARDELTYVNFEYRARNALPALVFMSITSLGNMGIVLLSLPLIIGTGLTVALLIVVLLRDRLVRRVINRMTENGYV